MCVWEYFQTPKIGLVQGTKYGHVLHLIENKLTQKIAENDTTRTSLMQSKITVNTCKMKAKLLEIEYSVGVQLKETIRVAKIDQDFFSGDE